MSFDSLGRLIYSACMEAREAAEDAYATLGDTGACGFAWVSFPGVKGNTRMGRQLKELGLHQDHTRTFILWNPSKMPVQSVAVLEAGAVAAAQYLNQQGIKAYAASRLD